MQMLKITLTPCDEMPHEKEELVNIFFDHPDQTPILAPVELIDRMGDTYRKALEQNETLRIENADYKTGYNVLNHRLRNLHAQASVDRDDLAAWCALTGWDLFVLSIRKMFGG